MKKFLIVLMLPVLIHTALIAVPYAGFYLPDSLTELRLRYKTVNNLIILPVRINDSINVNLILDTGCRNMLLFGKEFHSLLNTSGKPVQFSGLGSGNPVSGKLAIDNNVSIGAVQGHGIPIIVVSERNIFSSMKDVHGIIGYEIFIKFEIELNMKEKMITFRPATKVQQHSHFSYVPMNVVDSRPVVECIINDGTNERRVEQLLIDTGSTLGLLLGKKNNNSKGDDPTIGRGLNGAVRGYKTIVKTVKLQQMEFRNVATSVITQKDKYASIGLDLLKDYVVVLNYTKNYVGFRSA